MTFYYALHICPNNMQTKAWDRHSHTLSSVFKFSIHMVLLSSEALLSGRSVSMEHVILVAEDVVVDVVFLGRLRRQHKRLHERTHRSIVVGKLTDHLSADNLHLMTTIFYSNNYQTMSCKESSIFVAI